MKNGKRPKQELHEYESCEEWLNRGYKAYRTGDLSKAEDLYSEGIKCCIQPLFLCYRNRASTLMSVSRIREAINDLVVAVALNPSFLETKLRAARCYLLLGEVAEAMQYYKSCLGSRMDVCLDRKIAIEAADGLQKAEKVAESFHRSAQLLQQKTPDAATSALAIIAEALTISSYSEKLLQMKGEGLCELRMYDEAIKLCEQTLDFAENNFAFDETENTIDSVRLWRWRIMSKCYYHLGKLEAALHLIEKQEQVTFVKDGSGNNSQDSSIPLGTTIRELLARKKAGNEAFQSGKFAEALDHYNAAISTSVESQPFAAICFCNRAAAHQSLGRIIDAIADCSVAMALDKNYTKAASRRATLREMIRDYVGAVTDLQRLISVLELGLMAFVPKVISMLENHAQEKAYQDWSNGICLTELRKVFQWLSSSSSDERAKYGIHSNHVSSLERFISLRENQAQEKDHQARSQDRSNDSNLKELRKARQRLSSIEEKAKCGRIPLDLYLILGIKSSDPESVIKKAYKKAALKHHPDKVVQFLATSVSMHDEQLQKDISEKLKKDAECVFKMIGEAYAVLSDSVKRSKYNREEQIRRGTRK